MSDEETPTTEEAPLPGSNLLRRLASSAAAAIDDHSEDWVERLVESGREAVNNADLDDVPEELHEHVPAALDALEAAARPAARLGLQALGWVVALLEDDKETEARRRYIETDATFAERRAFMQAAGDRAQREGQERQDSWDALQEALTKGGEVVVKALGFVLAGAIGV